MKEPAKNIAASIQARLRNEADQQGIPFAEVLQYYAMERFLYRLSKSQYVDKFILKGGLLLYGWNVPLRRPTRDMDFRGYLENSEKSVLKAIREIVAEPVPDDGIQFNTKRIQAQETQIDADYEGMRVKFTALLGTAKIPMQIDLTKLHLQHEDIGDFVNVVEEIWLFLELPLQACIKKTKSTHNWIPHKGWK